MLSKVELTKSVNTADEDNLLSESEAKFERESLPLMEERSLPSISLAVVSGQELVYARAFGFADLEEELADEAPLESALSLTASGEDRFTAPTAQGFYAGELTVEFVRNSDGCIQALRLNRELLPRR